MNVYSALIERFALPAISLLTESRFGKLYGEFSASPSEHVLAEQYGKCDKLGELLQHAYDNVPFYRGRMEESGIRPQSMRNLEELAKLPPTTKHDIAAHFPDGITDTSEQFKPWRYRSTSGTIERLTVIHD